MEKIIRNIVEDTVRKTLLEKLEIENPQYEVEKVFQKVVQLIKEKQEWGWVSFNGMEVEICLTDSNKYGGSFFVNLFSIYCPFENTDFDIVKEIVYHELTHNINRKEKNRTGRSFPGIPNCDDYVNKVRDILYRLWCRDERIAYLTKSISGVEESKRYIDRLKKEIYDIEHSIVFNGEETWEDWEECLIWDKIIPEYGVFLPFKTPMARKNFFIKKSKHLLNWFEKKLLKNAYRFEMMRRQ